MRPLPLCFALLLISGCARNNDTFAPRIVMSGAEGGVVSQPAQAQVRGYVLDDVGVSRVSVDGKPVEIKPGASKIANFSFQPQGQAAKKEYLVEAADAAGHVTKLSVTVVVDAAPPTLRVLTYARSGNRIRVSGVATDNARVAQILIDGNRLNISPGPRVEFYAETTGIYADLEAIDAAGNRVKLRAQ